MVLKQSVIGVPTKIYVMAAVQSVNIEGTNDYKYKKHLCVKMISLV